LLVPFFIKYIATEIFYPLILLHQNPLVMKALLRHRLLALFLLPAFNCFAQEWQDVSESSLRISKQLQVIKPEKYILKQLQVPSLLTKLVAAPKEFTVASSSGLDNIITLPMPDGSLKRFRFSESPVMEPALAAKYPEIKTYSAQGVDDPFATLRMDYNPYSGFHAQILSPSGNIFIDPYAKGNTQYYMSYFTKDFKKESSFTCGTPVPVSQNRVARLAASGPCRGTQLFTYRLAMACTGEYATEVCLPAAPTVPATLAAITTSVNRVSGLYENELTVRFLLVANTDLLIYLDGTTDPYTNNSGNTMLTENQTNTNTIITSANYDIGHVFSTGGGGIAYLGCVCTANKAGGVTGSPNPVGDPFDIDYVAHEMGHQFGGDHTFNSVDGSCAGNRNATTAYEVGSGTTIMAYAGICDADDIQPNSDPFFHTVSFDQISNFIATGAGASCHGTIATGNSIPVITAMSNNGVTIPELTPFILSATATDANGDALTYCWEEWDLGAQDTWDGGANSTTKPLFKSREPKTSGIRMIPDINVILAGYPANPAATNDGLKGETMSDPNGPATRVIKFRLTVRDNRAGGGGIATGGGDAANLGCSFGTAFAINVKGATGPFLVNAPNGGESWLGGTSQIVTWDVASTDVAPVSTANVNILLSTDGGLTYPTTLLSNTPNDGTQSVTIPNIPTTSAARIMVRGAGNIFFDISNANFTIIFNGPLPVGMLDFNAQAKTNHIELGWKTVFEQNSLGFEIQRSTGNAANFSAIGFSNSQGTGFVDRNYSANDNNVKKNTRYYYRLKQVDLDGKSTYSPVRSVILKDSRLANITVNPNPVTDNIITIKMNENRITSLQAQVIDVAGRVLSDTRFGTVAPGAVLTMPVKTLSAGVYTLRLVGDGETETIRFVKQ
jgi:Metallo-peptidase family M12